MTTVEMSLAARPPLIFGWHIDDPDNPSLLGLVNLATNFGISFVVVNLNTYGRRSGSTGSNPQINHSDKPVVTYESGGDFFDGFTPIGQSDMCLTNRLWSQKIVSLIQTDDLDSLALQVGWSVYVSARAVIIDMKHILNHPSEIIETVLSDEPDENLVSRLTKFSEKILHYLKQPSGLTIWLSITSSEVSWHVWYKICELCQYNENLKVCLNLETSPTNLDRWLAEPLKCVMLPESALILTDERLKIHPDVAEQLEVLLTKNVKVAFDSNLDYHNLSDKIYFFCSSESEDEDIPEPPTTPNIKDYLKEVKALYASLKPMSVQDYHARNHWDVLMEPMQPLRDNLDSKSYDSFEQCRFKYYCYIRTLKPLISKILDTTPDAHLVVYVLGAGRGPLLGITATFFEENEITNYTIFALDKNPYTMITLRHLIWLHQWKNVVLLCYDMRNVDRTMFKTASQGKKRIHIVISELLGSFGDNELAPECLYSFEKIFHDNEVVHFIPQSYTSYVMPIHTTPVWTRIKNSGDSKNLHSPYTCWLKSHQNLATEYMPCFNFEHPSGNPEVHNDSLERHQTIEFEATETSYVHGFAGYFKSKIYDEIGISTIPGESPYLRSWFPMFFPIETPFLVKKSEIITLQIWRKADETKVWYEWAFTTPTETEVHNPGGLCHYISKLC